jgi:RNA polymerase sigma factor (TIGR02999 family)
MPDDGVDGLNVTALLRAHVAGDPNALDRLLPRVYDELRRIARRRLARERLQDFMCSGEIVHDAILTLLPMNRIHWRSRGHFFAVASRAMRNALVDHALRRRTLKRGGGKRTLPLDEGMASKIPSAEPPIDEIVDVSDALARLRQLDPRKARVVECLSIVGLSLRETAEALGISVRTVSREWSSARAWLTRALCRESP